MVEKDIQFSIKKDLDLDVDCFLLACKNVSETEINVIFSQSDDSPDTLRYGRIIMDENGFTLSNKITEPELEELKELLTKEIKNSVAKIVALDEESAR